MNKLIIKAAEQYGFNLEFKTSEKLEENGFDCELNKILILDDNQIEIDVIAKRRDPNLHLIMECKGAAKDTVLLLVKGANSRIKSDALGNLVTRYDISTKTHMPIFAIDHEKIVYTITGDFFQKKTETNKEKLTKISKDDQQNNFYKAQNQVLNAISAYSKIPNANPSGDRDHHHIVPLIVTNADIWVVDYNESNPKVSQQKGVLHRVINDPSAKLQLRYNGSSLVNSFVVPVVNYQHIDVVLKELSQPQALLSQINLDLRLETQEP